MISSIAHLRRNFLARYWGNVGRFFRDIIRSRLLNWAIWVGQRIGRSIWWNFLGPFRVSGAWDGNNLGLRGRQACRAGHRNWFSRFRAHDGLLLRRATDTAPFLFRKQGGEA
ncbi:hypothetical protein ASD02_31730 [Ensifer sp. Root1252]|nr:hypothetical protein ASD00_30345 [Ensifer sp. Root31]KQW52668.1 hypothetical protein ASD02_31730 [Ensifer sp. Root1252]KQW78545.1 hypothetical protein ASD03_26035 [Ensifer sp. Root127]KQY68486.1 hypothetical protein ASD52_33395 [Ensifer sp. Root142]KRC71082.1 hypothetical protein ASE32_33720 [Ensifer sp. Root231]KRC96114.1 hypothetical protein ASE47_32890 [Ensifer sp. Root258]